MKQIISMGVVLLVLGGAALLNPSEDRHKDAIVAQYKAQNPTVRADHDVEEVSFLEE